jgi:hypothetical protein
MYVVSDGSLKMAKRAQAAVAEGCVAKASRKFFIDSVENVSD